MNAQKKAITLPHNEKKRKKKKELWNLALNTSFSGSLVIARGLDSMQLSLARWGVFPSWAILSSIHFKAYSLPNTVHSLFPPQYTLQAIPSPYTSLPIPSPIHFTGYSLPIHYVCFQNTLIVLMNHDLGIYIYFTMFFQLSFFNFFPLQLPLLQL